MRLLLIALLFPILFKAQTFSQKFDLRDDSLKWGSGSFYSNKIKVIRKKSGPIIDSAGTLTVDSIFHFLKRHPEIIIEVEHIEKRANENAKTTHDRQAFIAQTIVDVLIEKGIAKERLGANVIHCRKLKIRPDTISGKVTFISGPRPGTWFRVISKDYVDPKGPKFQKNFSLSDSILHVGQILVVGFPRVWFEPDRSVVTSASYPFLDSLADFLNVHKDIVLEVQVHFDCRGNEATMGMASMNRAESICDYLASKGINSKRLIAKGYGALKPVVAQNGQALSCFYIASLPTKQLQEEAHAKNRRIEFRIAEF